MPETLRDGAKAMAEHARPSELNHKLEQAMEAQPVLPHITSLRVVLTAAAIGAGVALVLLVLASPILAGLGLVIAFFGAWGLLAARSYDRAG